MRAERRIVNTYSSPGWSVVRETYRYTVSARRRSISAPMILQSVAGWS
jgi:hypothetical protein